MKDSVTVHKLNLAGETVLSYAGRLLARGEDQVVVEATFERQRMELDYVTLETGDRFVETFYTRRWYNVFTIYASDGVFKGWYCNVTRPAEITETASGSLEVRAVDLALDFFVQPGGREFVLDEDEFEALGLAPDEALAARGALEELRELARARMGPFAA